VFRWERWKQLSDNWNHDHCKACWARFAERPEEWNGMVHAEGWVTLWPTGESATEPIRGAGQIFIPSPKFRGFQMDWLCSSCFESVREELGFVVDPEHSQWKQAGL
jgi:hypothetical protein